MFALGLEICLDGPEFNACWQKNNTENRKKIALKM